MKNKYKYKVGDRVGVLTTGSLEAEWCDDISLWCCRVEQSLDEYDAPSDAFIQAPLDLPPPSGLLILECVIAETDDVLPTWRLVTNE